MDKIKNLKVRIAALALSGAMVFTTLTGCAKKSYLSNTDLEEAKVITYEDGNKDVVKHEGYCTSYSCDEKIYRSIVTNEYIVNDNCKEQYYTPAPAFTSHYLNHYNIDSIDSIASYLTTDEIIKAAKGELTDDDVFEILKRILNNNGQKENSNIKIK